MSTFFCCSKEIFVPLPMIHTTGSTASWPESHVVTMWQLEKALSPLEDAWRKETKTMGYMKQLKSVALMLLIALSATTGSARNVRKTVYLFGLAASFNDSTVYVTDVQRVDSAWVDSRTRFLFSRDAYSQQLRQFLTEKGEKDRTCITTFAFDEKEAIKKFDKLIGKYTNNKKANFDIRYLKSSDFAYEAVQPVEENNTGDKEAPSEQSGSEQ